MGKKAYRIASNSQGPRIGESPTRLLFHLRFFLCVLSFVLSFVSGFICLAMEILSFENITQKKWVTFCMIYMYTCHQVMLPFEVFLFLHYIINKRIYLIYYNIYLFYYLAACMHVIHKYYVYA